MSDVVVAGSGPAGWAVAAACAREGLHTVLVDPAPDRHWPATYALWRDELPELPATAVAAAPRRVLAAGTTLAPVARDYLIVDNAGLRAWLTDDRVDVVTGAVRAAHHGPRGATVVLADGRRLATGVVVDATGARRVLTGGPPRGPCTEQTAFGVVLPAADAAALLPDPAGTALFMDWRAPAPAADPGFCYVIPLGRDRVLVEETSLARRPGLGLDVLATRLRSRLAAAGITARGTEERVRIPLDLPLPRPDRTVPFGVAAGLVHPATGYSVATSLRLAPLVAAAVAGGLGRGPRAAARAAWHELWPPGALAVHALRRHGLRALRALPPELVPAFFDAFFALPVERQRAFTSERTNPRLVAAAMAALFRPVPWRLRAALTLPLRP
ncbi:lycopene beta-cyclase [Amycolatopsis arida]|uniref:Lycopene beta-cyclase n=1 Tax=Amycolatopsis arida TaxID=587909 RepID=A0A1I5YZX8_9PSEU|nr:lycopene cyclase family protein [Amycolatopsis arida]TDX90011.1 lycopene beta-cyclase [Amycolatopsis arida]SFQ49762.1 lycopene beta-cyclase [Amycolatopsis arida]